MILNTSNNQISASFLGRAKDMDGKEFVVKVVCYNNPVASTDHFGDVYAAEFIEDAKGEIIFTRLHPKLTDEQVKAQGDLIVSNIDKVIDELVKGGKNG